MREIVPTTQFRRDAKRVEKRGRDLDELQEIVKRLAAGETLEPRQLRHSALIGLWRDREDIRDSAAYARQLREQAQTRQG